jgi:hypothetical protein
LHSWALRSDQPVLGCQTGDELKVVVGSEHYQPMYARNGSNLRIRGGDRSPRVSLLSTNPTELLGCMIIKWPDNVVREHFL